MIGRLQTAVEFASEDTSPWGELKLIGGTANPDLNRLISEAIGVKLTDPRVNRFSDGEIDVKIQDSMRGHDCFVIQPTCHPVNENLMELFILLDALRRASAGRITAVIPYYGYARKERKSQPREPISAKLMANFVTLAGADRVLLLDLHADAIEGFFDVPTDHLTANKILAGHIRSLGLDRCAVVAPDAGGAKRAESMAKLLQAPIVFVYKRRPREEAAEIMEMAGEVEGRDCVVVEDIISTGGTVVEVARALRAHGARRVLVACSHAVLTRGASARLREADIDEVIVTDSIPVPEEKRGAPLTVLSVAPLLAEAILRVHENRSVSELFR
ncbi:MAG: ribose-phosphate pyrophosphokinase [Candidatus Dormibacteraeota bacterium]|uniref:ribose-phosphate diphosphokinase n=1 Tax=Candidatus Dormibacter sp. TaxID=2973982 RepID=UPI000DB37088|nr:ribose-phosphate pyrophosphokinase [Candidatus Dormibacteraeota bacterium]PZR71592.1 MAG: ribose-phosphate pyrophosphokinase [Candidatus Dormibacteraeota bacterium]